MNNNYRDGLQAAADFLCAVAVDFEKMAVRLRAERSQLGPKAYALRGAEVNALLSEARHADEKAALLRRQAERIRKLPTPDPDGSNWARVS